MEENHTEDHWNKILDKYYRRIGAVAWVVSCTLLHNNKFISTQHIGLADTFLTPLNDVFDLARAYLADDCGKEVVGEIEWDFSAEITGTYVRTGTGEDDPDDKYIFTVSPLPITAT